MENVRTLIQTKLDNILLSKGIMSHHLRRVKVDTINHKSKSVAINNDEYVVYRIVSSKNRAYGDGVAKMTQYYIDINYYYAYDKNDTRFINANKQIQDIIQSFLTDKKIRLANGQSDIYDIDNPYRGINVEFLLVGVEDNGG